MRTNPATGAETSENAEVLSTVGGTVLRIGNRIEVLREDNLPARVIFDKVPDNLRARPTLSVLVNAAKPVQRGRAAHLSHTRPVLGRRLCGGVRRDTRPLSLQGWITLSNKSGTSFANARTQLVAGDLKISDSEQDGMADACSKRRRPGRGHRKHRSSEAQRLLPLSDPAADHGREQPDQAGQLPGIQRRQSQQGLRSHVLGIPVQ